MAKHMLMTGLMSRINLKTQGNGSRYMTYYQQNTLVLYWHDYVIDLES